MSTGRVARVLIAVVKRDETPLGLVSASQVGET
jgi:hypothetical protein